MDKVERLMTLTATLLDTARPLTVDELRERMGSYYPEGDAAFHRAFERDKDDLREMGIPIAVERVDWQERPTEGYRIHRDDYYLRDPGLDSDELAALNVALSAVRLEGVQGLEALWKLGGVVDVDESDAVPLASLPSDPRLADLFGAVVDRRTATFRYHDQDRRVDPYRIDYRRGHWYVRGLDQVSNQPRVFRLDRIDGPVTLGPVGGFERGDLGEERSLDEPWRFGEGPPRRAELLVDADQAPLARQYLGADAVADEREDGSVVFALDVTLWPALRSFVLTFLDHAELLSPPDLRAALVEWLEAMAGESA